MARFTNTEEYSAYEVDTVGTADMEEIERIRELERMDAEMEAFDQEYEARMMYERAHPWVKDPRWQREVEMEEMEREMAQWAKEDEERKLKEAEERAAWKPATEAEMDQALQEYYAMMDRERTEQEAKERALREALEEEQRIHKQWINMKMSQLEEWMERFPEDAKAVTDIESEEQLHEVYAHFEALWAPVKRAQDEAAEKARQVELEKERAKAAEDARKKRHRDGKARALKKIGPNSQKARKAALLKKRKAESKAKVAEAKEQGTYKGKRQQRKERQEKAEKAAKEYQARMGVVARTSMMIKQPKYFSEDEEDSEAEVEEPIIVKVATNAPVLGVVETKVVRTIEAPKVVEPVEEPVVEPVEEPVVEPVEEPVEDMSEDEFLAQWAAVRGEQWETPKPKRKRSKRKPKVTPKVVEEVKEVKESPKRSSKRGTVLNIQIGKTYTEAKRDGDVHYDARCKGFETMADKKALEKRLTKTAMCRSVATGKRCKHKKCRFAHSIDELTIRVCAFGDQCKFARYCSQTQKWVNRGGKASKVCNCKHPGEEDADYFARCGIKCPTQARKAAQPKRLPLKVRAPVTAKSVIPSRPKGNPWGKVVKPVVKQVSKPKVVPKVVEVPKVVKPVSAPSKVPKKVIRVPAAMFEKTLEMLMARGMLDSVEIQCT